MLNQRLYDQLRKAFGEVKIASEGIPFKGQPRVRALASRVGRDGKRRTPNPYVKVEERGESYQVCCPFCGDKRFRLYFQHRWGTKYKGLPITYAAKCYNEECHERPDFYKKVCDMLDGYLAAPKPITESARVRELVAMSLPGTCVDISALPKDHPVIRYLRERGFDPADLAKNWDVAWRVEGSALSDEYRLIIPIYTGTPDAKVLAGWQARYYDMRTFGPKPPDKYTPKYMTSPGLRKAQVLFNGWRMSTAHLVVICEGPFDAMRVGAGAVAILGSDISARQESMVIDNWTARKAPIAVMLDNDMDAKAEKLTRRLVEKGCLAVRVNAPGGKDPGDCTREELMIAIATGLTQVQTKERK